MKLIPELVVDNVKRTVEYYQSLFEFKLTNKVEDGEKYSWASLESKDGGLEIMFISHESVVEDVAEFKDQKNGGSIILFVEMENVSELYKKIKTTETIVKDLYETFYGTTEFIMKDLNGYLLIFAQRENGK